MAAVRDGHVRIVVEGDDDQAVLEAYLGFLGVEASRYSFHQLKNYDHGRLKTYLTALRAARDPLPSALLIVVDADVDPVRRNESIRTALRENGFPFPRGDELVQRGHLTGVGPEPVEIDVGVFLFPDGQRSGTLEDLLIASLICKTEQRECVEGFLECLDAIGVSFHGADRGKAYLQLCACAGGRAQVHWRPLVRDMFDFGGQAYAPLKRVITAMGLIAGEG